MAQKRRRRIIEKWPYLLEKVVAAPMLLDTYTLARDWAIFDFSDFSFRLLLFWHQIIKPSGFLDL